MKEYYSPEFLAGGGPAIDGPAVAEASDGWVDMAAVALCVLPPGSTPENFRFGVVDTSGQIVAAANTAAELIAYLDNYADALDEAVAEVSEWTNNWDAHR